MSRNRRKLSSKSLRGAWKNCNLKKEPEPAVRLWLSRLLTVAAPREADRNRDRPAVGDRNGQRDAKHLVASFHLNVGFAGPGSEPGPVAFRTPYKRPPLFQRMKTFPNVYVPERAQTLVKSLRGAWKNCNLKKEPEPAVRLWLSRLITVTAPREADRNRDRSARGDRNGQRDAKHLVASFHLNVGFAGPGGANPGR